MKIKLSFIIVLMAIVGFTYTSCKKNSSSPSGPALTNKQVSSQVALNVTQMLTSGFGAYSITGGLNAPGTLGMVKTKNGLKVNSTGDPLCGTIADTTLNYTYSDGGNSASVKGDLKFAFTCTNGELSGFNITDNLTVAESTSEISVNYKLIEDLTIQALILSNSNSGIQLDGSLSLAGSYNYKANNKGSGTAKFSYVFHSITTDSAGEITGGSADFQTSGTGTNGVWNCTGTIKFLGNQLAQITINGTTYSVDLNTGAVS